MEKAGVLANHATNYFIKQVDEQEELSDEANPESWTCPENQRTDPLFEKRLGTVLEHYFSRNPKYWPCFADPGLKAITDFRLRRLIPGKRLDAYPGGRELHRELRRDSQIPFNSTAPTGEPDESLIFVAALSKDWENPASVENVITMPCYPGIYGSILRAMSNPNLVYQEYAGMANTLEKCVIRQIVGLVGYDADRATGVFTQGETFCNLYGYLVGIRKSLPEARHYGMGYTHDNRFINSQGGHYSDMTNLSLVGVDIKQRSASN